MSPSGWVVVCWVMFSHVGVQCVDIIKGGSTFITHDRLVVAVVLGHELWDKISVLVRSQVVSLSQVILVDAASHVAMCHGRTLSREDLGRPANCAEDRVGVHGR
eukprot:726626-Pyramimonas_sp.AAC.1